MLRILRGVCHFPRTLPHMVTGQPNSLPRFVALGAGVLLSISAGGCMSFSGGSEHSQARIALRGLAAEASDRFPQEISNDKTNSLVGPKLASDSTTVSRMQKPDAESVKQGSTVPVIDRVKYEVAAPADTKVAARIRATVNGSAILDEEVKEAVYPFLLATATLPEPERSARQKDAFEKEVQHLIDREVVLQMAFSRLKDRPNLLDKFNDEADKEFDKKVRDVRKRAGVKTDEELRAFLRVQGITMEGMRRQIRRNFMYMEFVRGMIVPKLQKISPEEIREYFQKHPEEFTVNDNVTWQHIWIDAGKHAGREAARQFAEQIVARARAGEDFQKMAMKHDNGDSTYRNGEGFGHRPGEIKPAEAEAQLFKMRDGDIGSIIEQGNGLHIFKLVKREYAGLKAFDEKTQSTIKNKLQNELWDREYKQFIAELRRKASIEVSVSAQ